MSAITDTATHLVLEGAIAARRNARSAKEADAASIEIQRAERVILQKSAEPGAELRAKVEALRAIHGDDLRRVMVEKGDHVTFNGRELNDASLRAALNSILADVFG